MSLDEHVDNGSWPAAGSSAALTRREGASEAATKSQEVNAMAGFRRSTVSRLLDPRVQRLPEARRATVNRQYYKRVSLSCGATCRSSNDNARDAVETELPDWGLRSHAVQQRSAPASRPARCPLRRPAALAAR